MVKFQTYDYKFPLRGFAVLFVIENVIDNKRLMIPFTNLFKTHREIIRYCREYEKVFTKSTTNSLPNNFALILPLTFEKLVPLKKELWENPTIEYDVFRKMLDLTYATDKPELYNILILPKSHTKNKETFGVSVPVKIGTTTEQMDNYMKSSTEYVDPLAKNAALYSISKPYSINYKTSKVLIKGMLESEPEFDIKIN